MIVLSTAFSPGDVDPGKSYTHLRIVEIRINTCKKSIGMLTQHGYMESGEWTPGKVAPTVFTVTNGKSVNAYDNLVVASVALQTDVVAPGVSEYNVYAAAGRCCYQWLIDKGYFAGTLD